MKFTINGFVSSQKPTQPASPSPETLPAASAPRKSVVQVRFPGWDKGLAYYNDQFDLKPGDRVYVDGKLEGQLGIVTAVNYNFKIKLSEYKRVIALVKTDVHGKFYMAGSHFVTFDPNVLSPAQATLWFRAPASEEEEYAQTGCFAAICKETLFAFAVRGKECGSFTM